MDLDHDVFVYVLVVAVLAVWVFPDLQAAALVLNDDRRHRTSH